MDLTELLQMIDQGILHFTPFFRVAWAVTVLIGLVMLAVALVLKRNSMRKKSPWIVGGIGLLMVISSGTQLIASLLRN